MRLAEGEPEEAGELARHGLRGDAGDRRLRRPPAGRRGRIGRFLGHLSQGHGSEAPVVGGRGSRSAAATSWRQGGVRREGRRGGRALTDRGTIPARFISTEHKESPAGFDRRTKLSPKSYWIAEVTPWLTNRSPERWEISRIPSSDTAEKAREGVADGVSSARDRFKGLSHDVQKSYSRVSSDVRRGAERATAELKKSAEAARERAQETAESVREGYAKVRSQAGDVSRSGERLRAREPGQVGAHGRRHRLPPRAALPRPPRRRLARLPRRRP